MSLAGDGRRAVRLGAEEIARQQRGRLIDLVAYAREHSPYYRELYAGLPDRVEDVTLLPVTDKKRLMARFDDWVTDREVTRERVEAFVADLDLVGAPFQDGYLVATTSGTSGVRGLFLQDAPTVAVSTAIGARARASLDAGELLRAALRGGRTAIVTSPRGHFSTVASAARFARDKPLLRGILRVFSIDQPLADLVAGLNSYNPASLTGFTGTLSLLAEEREAGRLRIKPVMVIPGGETLTDETREKIAAAFHAKVRPAYAATECGFLSFSCSADWYHVNSDWAILEPVDAEHRPVPPGVPSHTVLLTNLANRVQPILRYDLGDSVLQRPDPCPCGSPLPAIRVQGRGADLLAFPGGARLSPMLFGIAMDRVRGVESFQVVQTAPATLRVRLRPGDDEVWKRAEAEITRLLADHRAGEVTVERAAEAPERSAGGKLRRVVPYDPRAGG